MNARIAALPTVALAQFCQRNHIQRMSLFGSILRDDFRADSDVDVLVEFEAGKTPGLAFFSLPQQLEPIFGRSVDMTTRAAVEASKNYLRRKSILDSAVEVYAKR